VASRPLSLDDQAIERAVGMVGFHSRTVRAFKLDGLEDRCEDYGQVAIYRGSVAHSPHRLVLDDHHVFPAGKPIPVCGNTAAMLAGTRFAAHFDIIGDTRVHHGLFPCAPADPDGGAAGCGC
jgi:arsenite methyltransferase